MEVSLVTVGDELLTGDTINTNAAWLGRELTDRGVDVRQVTVIPDEIDVIVTIVGELRNAHDAVIVTGGLGPTHDDLTMEAIATLFEKPMVQHEEVLRWLVDSGGYDADDLTPGTTELPAGATPLHNEVGVAPGAKIENVYVLPGVPAEMEAMYERIQHEFTGAQRYRQTVRTDESESKLVSRLYELRENFDVTVGSYPDDDVTIRITGETVEEVTAAVEWLRERVHLSDEVADESYTSS